jgi:hypothetical protein
MRGWIFSVVALALSAALVAYTFTSVPELSGFAAGLLKAALAVGAFWAFDRFVLKEIDTLAELKAGNVAYGLMLLSLSILLAATVATAGVGGVEERMPGGVEERMPEGVEERMLVGVEERAPGAVGGQEAVPLHLAIARSYVGTVEEGGHNRGEAVERFQRAVGIPPGSPWCAAFAGYVLDAAERRSGRSVRPAVRSGVASEYIGGPARPFESVQAREVLRGVAHPPVGSLVVWRRGDTWRGHIGFVDRSKAAQGGWRGPCGDTIEGNTSAGAGGSQSDGGGVWQRRRCISQGSYFRIVAFTPVTYG